MVSLSCPHSWIWMKRGPQRQVHFAPSQIPVTRSWWLSNTSVQLSIAALWKVKVHKFSSSLVLFSCLLLPWRAIALNAKKEKITEDYTSYRQSLHLVQHWEKSVRRSVTCSAVTHLVRSNFRTLQLPIILTLFFFTCTQQQYWSCSMLLPTVATKLCAQKTPWSTTSFISWKSL